MDGEEGAAHTVTEAELKAAMTKHLAKPPRKRSVQGHHPTFTAHFDPASAKKVVTVAELKTAMELKAVQHRLKHARKQLMAVHGHAPVAAAAAQSDSVPQKASWLWPAPKDRELTGMLMNVFCLAVLSIAVVYVCCTRKM